MKHCIKCCNVKEISNFPVNKSHKDGRANICKECMKNYARLFRENNKSKDENRYLNITYKKICGHCKQEKFLSCFPKCRERSDGFLNICNNCNKSKCLDWRNDNLELVRHIDKLREKTTERKLQKQNYQKSHLYKYAAYANKRRASILKRIPKWTTQEKLKAIEEFYKNCPKGYEVDHIIPLQGKNVSGLHVLTNLQYLTVTQNRNKSNKFEPSYEEFK